MSSTSPSPLSAAHGRYANCTVVTPDRLEIIRGLVSTKVASSIGTTHDELLDHLVRSAINTFLNAPEDVDQLIPLLEAIGERQARLGWTLEQLSSAFKGTSMVVQRGLTQILSGVVDADTLTALREELMAFLMRLYRHIRPAFERVHRIHAIPDASLRKTLSSLIFLSGDTAVLEEMQLQANLDPQQRYVVVLAIDSEIPASLRDDERTLDYRMIEEILVPESWLLSGHLADQLHGRAVFTPAVPLSQAQHALALGRQACALIRNGIVDDDRALVPCTDLLHFLIPGSNPLLVELLIDKHLQPLQRMSRARRLALGTTLLDALGHGVPTNQLARIVGLPTQTMHSRMKILRDIFGPALTDPTQRLELIIALRVALARWETSPK